MPSFEQQDESLCSPRGCGEGIERQETMRATSVIRLVVLGAVGFGIGGAITRPLSLLLPGMVGLLLTLLIAGAVGGASLGLALMDWRRVVILAVLGAPGLTVGVMAGLTLGSFISHSEVPIAAIAGRWSVHRSAWLLEIGERYWGWPLPGQWGSASDSRRVISYGFLFR